jgi:hypothetical protein
MRTKVESRIRFSGLRRRYPESISCKRHDLFSKTNTVTIISNENADAQIPRSIRFVDASSRDRVWRRALAQSHIAKLRKVIDGLPLEQAILHETLPQFALPVSTLQGKTNTL